MCLSKPKTPKIAAPVAGPSINISSPPAPPPAIPSKDVTENASRARQDQRDRVQKFKGQKSTLMTGGLGLDEKAKPTKKKLLSGTS